MSAIERPVSDRVTALPGVSHSPLEGSLANFGKTVAEINELGTNASRLFRAYTEQKAKIEDEHGITMDGGIDPHMMAALDHYRKATRTT